MIIIKALLVLYLSLVVRSIVLKRTSAVIRRRFRDKKAKTYQTRKHYTRCSVASEVCCHIRTLVSSRYFVFMVMYNENLKTRVVDSEKCCGNSVRAYLGFLRIVAKT